MRTLWREILLSLFMGMAVPALLISYADMLLNRPEPEETAVTEMPAAQETVFSPMRLRQEDGTVSEMDMDTYLVGVVLAEMPASFEEEALKAQAVVARTYATKAYETGGKHGDGSVCTQASCCQAYLPEAYYRNRGGTEDAVQKVSGAVMATSGYVVTYKGELIEATYFSCSGGRTEDAVAVWGTDYPYLRSVESPGEEATAAYSDAVSFTPQQFQQMLGTELSGSPDHWFGAATYTAGGGVNTLQIGAETYTGVQLRSLLGLRSTAFSVSATEEEIRLTTRGYGHRVGMSQYGADAMAVGGCSFEEILLWYYPGTEITRMETT